MNQIGSSDGSPKNIDEEVLSALVVGHRTRALLLLHRARGGDLAANWRIISDLDDRKSFDRPGQDPAYTRVERYLSGSGSLKDKLTFVIPLVAVLFAGLALMATAWPRFSTGLRSYSWPTAPAEVVNARQFQRRRLVNTREQTEHLMDYQYRYSVDSAQFTKVIKSRAYYPALGEKPVAIGDVIEVLYDPDNPGTCLHGRDMYQRSLLFVLGALIALVACAPLALVGWFEYDRRALAQHDPISMTA